MHVLNMVIYLTAELNRRIRNALMTFKYSSEGRRPAARRRAMWMNGVVHARRHSKQRMQPQRQTRRLVWCQGIDSTTTLYTASNGYRSASYFHNCGPYVEIRPLSRFSVYTGSPNPRRGYLKSSTVTVRRLDASGNQQRNFAFSMPAVWNSWLQSCAVTVGPWTINQSINQSCIFRVVQVTKSLQDPLELGNNLPGISDNVRKWGLEQKCF